MTDIKTRQDGVGLSSTISAFSSAVSQAGPEAVLTGGMPASALSDTKGFVRRSSPKVEIGPWPGTKVTSSPRGQSFSTTDRTRAAGSLCGKSVRPTDPLNRTSPTCAKRAAALKKIT